MFIVIVTYVIIYKTKYGLRLRSIGDNPQAAQTEGVNIQLYRWVVVIISGIIAGLARSYLYISLNNLFVKDMVAGRGFMELSKAIEALGEHEISFRVRRK